MDELNPDARRRLQLLATGIAWTVLLASIVATAISWWNGGIVFDLLRGDLSSADKIARLREFFAGFGPAAPLVYFLLVTAEVVVAPIPGLMLYAPGGVIFGAFWGGAVSLAGNVAGAGVACLVARSLGGDRLAHWFATEKMTRVRTSLEQYGGWLVFLLRLNPLTSSDVVSYAAGLTEIPVRTVMLATAAGMAPLCFAQAWLAESLLTAFPQLIYGLVIACGVYFVVVVWIVRGMCKCSNEGLRLSLRRREREARHSCSTSTRPK
jgi:uncharacterized membrane protein YdjX (TVP38/TMEM64 family)